MYGYNPAGRVTTQDMSVIGGSYNSYNNISFSATYQWDDEGRMTSLQYPTVTAYGSFGNMPATMPTAGYQYDINGRLSEMTMNNGSGPQQLAGATYYAAGQLHTLSWGPGTETRTYNSLGQLTSQSLPWYLNMTYNYSPTANNGRITSSVDGMTGESTTYTYDALNRLTAASNSLWNQTYTYDGFGNLLTKSLANGSPNPSPSLNVTYNANNQQNGLSYDANGNQVSLPSCGAECSNTYNVENRLTWQVVGGWPDPANIYAYDPWGKRVMSGFNPAPWSGSQPNYTYTFYGITGQRLATLNRNGSNYPAYPICAITGQNVYYGKKLIVSGGVPVVTDRLGTVRADTQGESFAYYPYGEERSATPDGRNKFATYFRDTIGQDYADQRFYNAGTGRFWSPDPNGIKTAKLKRPGSWNRYAYVQGDPVNFGDPSGEVEVYMGSGACVVGVGEGAELTSCDYYGESWMLPEWPDPDQGGGGPPGRKVGPPSGAQFTGFNAAYDDLTNPDCAKQIAGTSGASAATLMTDLWNAGVTVGPAGNNADNNNPVNVVVNPNGVNYTYTYQTAYTSNGNIELNGNYFPDPTQQNIQIPGGTMSLLQAVNQALGTNMDATQFGAFVFLHELMHIANAGDNIDTKANNQAIVATCIH
jgi:RHS repeat-associated protein